MKKLSLIVLLFMLVGLEAQAQLKIGYTNPDLILSNMPEVLAIDQEIGALLAQKDTLLAERAAFYQTQIDNMVGKNLSQGQMAAKRDSISNEFENERLSNINEVQQRQNQLLQPIEEKVFETIKIVSDSLGLDLVLNEGSINGDSFIFYVSEDQIDITEMVIEKLKKS